MIGTGLLVIPKAFAEVGYVIGLIVLSVLAFMSYITATFVIEAHAIHNALIFDKNVEDHEKEDHNSGILAADLEGDCYESQRNQSKVAEHRDHNEAFDCLFNSLDGPHFDIREKAELGDLCQLFFNTGGKYERCLIYDNDLISFGPSSM